MGKIHKALKKAEKESTLINKGLGESVPYQEQREKDLAAEDSSKVVWSQASSPAPKKQKLLKKKKSHKKNVDSLITEQFRSLKTRVFYTRNGNSPRTLLITSALPFEGKSMVAANLAISLAHGPHEHALLVDCDFRKPDLHKLFGLTQKQGLADYLSGASDLPSLLAKTDTPKLTLLPVGKKPLDPLNLLASEKMKQLIRELKARYNDRYIIFDSSPVQFASETRMLMSQVDGIILVVKAGTTDREIVLRTIRDMDRDKFLGVVLNCLKKSLSNQQYYYYTDYENNTHA